MRTSFRLVAGWSVALVLLAAPLAVLAQPQPDGIASQATSSDWFSSPKGWVPFSQRSYEEASPGSGRSTGYRGAAGVITVYSYTLGVNDWRDAVDTTLVTSLGQADVGCADPQKVSGKWGAIMDLPVTIGRNCGMHKVRPDGFCVRFTPAGERGDGLDAIDINVTDAEEIGFFMKRARVAQATFGDAGFARERFAARFGRAAVGT